jgi:hypothetical protein
MRTLFIPVNDMPTYRTVTGKTAEITGPASESWPYPETRIIDGKVFTEIPDPDTGWGITYHYGPATREATLLGYFLHQYVEGRSSGFPFWPVVVLSARWTVAKLFRRL